MLIGVPKEIKVHEYRVGLTPSAVREYIARGHKVMIEAGAGDGILATDSAYRKAGATIIKTAEEIFEKAEMLVKVKEPQPDEWVQLRAGQLLFTYLHLAPDPKQAKGLLKSNCTAIAYETVTDDKSALPLLAPMSEVAGRLSIEAAGEAMRRSEGGAGILLGGVPGVQAGRVCVLGGGVVGTHAARMAVGLGAEVIIVDRSIPRLRQLDELFQGRVGTRYSTLDTIDYEISIADAVIGAVLIPGAAAPKLVTRAMLKHMKPGSVLVDVAIDQGGCFETSKPTTHADPTFVVDGIIHYCVANMPGSVPQTSAAALNNATLPYGLALAEKGLNALHAHSEIGRGLLSGLNVHKGKVTSKAVAESLGLAFVEPEVALAG
jgi:alanine dehydrogenase